MDKTPQHPTLRSAREAAGMSQATLAVAVGATHSAVSLWESGDRIPSGSARLMLALALGKPPEVVDAWFAAASRSAAAVGD